jgi:DNA replication protein DnaC
MTVIERLQSTLAGLGLTAVEARLESLLEQAAKAEPSYADFLLDVVGAEAEARRARYLKTRLQLAHLPYVKTFAQFDLSFQPSIDERQIRELQTLRFVHEASNVILLGPPGVGKTHLAVALAEAAIQAGQAAYFMTAHELVSDLARAYREGRLERRMRVYLAPKVLVIDENGLPAAGRSGSDHLLPVDQRPLRARQHHPDFEQELWRLGFHLRRPDHRHGHPGSLAPPLDHDQHPR